MTLDKQILLTEEYWRSFALSDEELEHLHDLIIGKGIPQTTTFLAYEVIERRCQAEAKAVKTEITGERVIPYHPRETFEKGQRLKFKRLGIARVVETWSEHHSYHGEYLALRVREEATGEVRVFMAAVKRGFEDYEPVEMEVPEGWGLGKPAPYVAPGEVVEQFGNYVREVLTNRLGQDERFVHFGEEWFLADLLERVSMQELTLVEKRIREAGEPLKLAALVAVPDEPQTDEDFVRRFSCNYALAQDGRFDNVGTVDAPLWFLLALEPAEVVTKPEHLAIPAVPSTREYEYIHEELEQVAKDLDDEAEETAPPPAEFIQSREPVRFVLNYAHLAAGAVPLTNRIRRVFPRPAGPRSWITFVDAHSGTRLAGWVMHEERYAWGLKEWYDAYGIRAGNYVTLQATENPTEIRVDFDELPQPRVERVRVATRGKDGSWRFEWQEREVRYKYDPLMFIAETRFEELESLDWEAEQVGKPIFEVMCDLFPALAESEGGNVHAKTLYQAVNLVRRCAPATVFCQLSQRVCFDPVGEGYWTYDPDLRDLKVIYQTKEEVGQRGKGKAKKKAERERDLWAELQRDERRKAALQMAIETYMVDPVREKVLFLREVAHQRIRELVAKEHLEALSLDEFNREVWQIGLVKYQGQSCRIDSEEADVSLKEMTIEELRAAYESGELEIEGNQTWGSSSGVIGSRLRKPDTEMEQIVKDTLCFLIYGEEPTEQRIDRVIRERNGFGINVVSGILHAVYPERHILYNRRSVDALKMLGISWPANWQQKVGSYIAYRDFGQQLQERFGFESLTDVDWFMYKLGRGQLPFEFREGKAVPSVEVPDIGIRHIVYPIPFVAGELPEQLLDDPAWDKLFREEQLSLWRQTWTGETLDEALMERIADKTANRFVTPRQVADFMVNVAQPKPGERVADICCGTGIFLVKAQCFVKEVYGENADLELYGADVYKEAVEATRLNLRANGAYKFKVIQANSLQEREDIFDTQYDLILGNPPFGGGQCQQFIQRWIGLLKEGGRMVVNVSEGVLANTSQADQELRHWLLENFEIEALISFPRPRDSQRYGAKSNVLCMRKLKLEQGHKSLLVQIEDYTQIRGSLDILHGRS